MYLKEMLLILFLSLLSSSLAFPFRVTKTHWRGSHILNSEDPDNNGDSCKSSPISGRLYEHIKDPDSSSLLENEVCDYGILTALAEEHIALSNYDEGMKLANDALEIADHTREVNNIYSAYAEGIIADAMYGLGQYQESAAHYHEALKTYEHHYQSNSGPEAVELVGATNVIAWNLLAKKDYEEATAAWSTTLGMTERLLGPRSVDVAGCMANLAISHMNIGNLGAVPEALLKKALAVYEEKKAEQLCEFEISEDQIEPIYKINSYLGDLYFMRGDDEQASGYYRSVETNFENGEINDLQAAKAFENLGIIEWRKGDKKHAKRLFEEAVFAKQRKLKSIEDEEILINLKDMLQSLQRGYPAPPVKPLVDHF